MPDMPNRSAKETAFSAAMRRAWEPFDRQVRRGEEPDWDKLAEASAKAAEEHIQAARRLAAVVLWLSFMDDLKQLASDAGQSKPPSGKQIGEELEASDRAEQLGRELARTSRDRWRDAQRRKPRPSAKASPEEKRAADRQSQEIDDELADSLWGSDRSGTVAATELTSAHTNGEAAARVAMENRGLGLVAIWVAEPGACPACRPLNGQPESAWAALYPGGPPSPHPNCRCHLRYERVRITEGCADAEARPMLARLLEQLERRLT